MAGDPDRKSVSAEATARPSYPTSVRRPQISLTICALLSSSARRRSLCQAVDRTGHRDALQQHARRLKREGGSLPVMAKTALSTLTPSAQFVYVTRPASQQ
jgi:hypothetical protein